MKKPKFKTIPAKALDPPGEDSCEPLTAEVRRECSLALSKQGAKGFCGEEVLAQSQTWSGFQVAFDSWHRALWTWIDDQNSAELNERMRLELSRSGWPKAAADATPEEQRHDVELARQYFLLRRAIFLSGLRFNKAQDPDWYSGFMLEIHVAKVSGDKEIFCKVAEMKQRKATKDDGDRQLKFALLFFWMSGCLWALTTDGIGAFLQAKFPRSSGKTYDNKTISDAMRDLKLCRSPRPHYWGFAGNPLRLQTLQ